MPAMAESWAVDAAEFPAGGSPPEKWEFLLRYAILAPSSHNSQPWLFHLRGEELDLYADRRRSCRVVDPADRELLMSCGCALFHLRAALRHFACLGEVTLFPDPQTPDLLARLRLGESEEASEAEAAIFHAIPKRRTNRQPFQPVPVPTAVLDALHAAAQAEGCWLHLADDEDTRYALADLIAEGDRRQWASKAFRIELSHWIHAERSTRRDGIPGYAQGLDDLLSSAGPMVVRTFDMGEGQAAKDHEVATGSPVLAVLGTDGDAAYDWVLAGQALARVLLRARADDLWSSFLNQPIEVADLRARVLEMTGRNGFPQALFRLGFAEDVKPTPRRELEDVVI